MLKKKERCPIHKRTDCCGRSEAPKRYGRVTPVLKYRMVAPGIREYPDGREVCSPAALEAKKLHLLRKSNQCVACHRPFDDYRDIELAHRESKGHGGSKRDDSFSNLVLLHRSANRAQGSKPLDVYLKERGGKDCPQ